MKTRWRRRTILPETARSALALAATGFVSLMQPLFSAWQMLLLPLVVLFAASLFTCIVRAMSEIVVDERGVRLLRPLLPDRRLDWADLVELEVRMFPLGRYRTSAITDMKLRGRACDILVDDGVEGFVDVVSRAWREARARGLGVSDVTHANLAALGLVPAGEA